MKKIVISGASGLVGRWLTADLDAAGHEVVRLVRRDAAAAEGVARRWNPARGELDPAFWPAPTPSSTSTVAASATAAGRRRSSSSCGPAGCWRPRTLAGAIANADPRPPLLVNASAVGLLRRSRRRDSRRGVLAAGQRFPGRSRRRLGAGARGRVEAHPGGPAPARHGHRPRRRPRADAAAVQARAGGRSARATSGGRGSRWRTSSASIRYRARPLRGQRPAQSRLAPRGALPRLRRTLGGVLSRPTVLPLPGLRRAARARRDGRRAAAGEHPGPPGGARAARLPVPGARPRPPRSAQAIDCPLAPVRVPSAVAGPNPARLQNPKIRVQETSPPDLATSPGGVRTRLGPPLARVE